jgi:asparagine synthase (glutamine-hydrolysing)
MCGITGFIDFKRSSTVKDLNRMCAAIAHRGPDSNGTSIIDLPTAQIGLGHQRLAIIDLSESGKQPMQFAHLDIVFNGEIYNYREIKQELIDLGHSFTGHSDTEVILHAYAQWGIQMIGRFIGMFAFVLIDRQQQKVYLVRDRAGVKPLFYYWKNSCLLFGSELKSFHEHPAFEKSIDPSAVADFMQYGNIPGTKSIFKDTHKLAPGHWISMDLTDSTIHTHQYWNVYNAYNQPQLEISLEEAIQVTEGKLKTAFDYRMVADVPVGVFLSGGYDSTSVAALLQNDRTEKLKTFTVSVPSIGLDEAPFAKEIAKRLGTDHTEIPCTTGDVLSLLNDLPFFYDEPFGDSSALPTMLVSKVARQHVKVALSADAGDELFAGYNRYDYLMRFGKRISSLPSWVRNTAAFGMDILPAERIPVLKNKYNFANRYEKLKGILRDPSPERIMLSLSRQYSADQLQKLVGHSPQSTEHSAYLSKELLAEFYTPLRYMMAIDYQTYLVDDILQKVDRATMAFSLEGREPFLDHTLIEYVAQLPDDLKYHKGEKKFLLKEIVHRHIPKSVMDRPKMGFAIPIGKWLRNELRDSLEAFVNKEKIEQHGLLNWEAVSSMKEAFYGGKTELDVKLWYVFMFQMWYERWMKK